MPTLRASHKISAFLAFMAAVAMAFPAAGQSVISAHSGVVYYLDGTVYLNDEPLESRLGRFPNVPVGAQLRTAQGHAEVLLTPGVFLRLGENTTIRMLSNELANTRVELEAGSVIVDSSDPASGTSVTLIFKDWQIHSADPGTYRMDADPPRLWVLKGNAEALTAPGEKPVRVSEGMDLPLAAQLRPEHASDEPADELNEWSKGRSESIEADNSITQQIDADPASQTSAGLDGFSYFPYLGVPLGGMRPYSGLYGSVLPGQPFQPGFYSMYLPGYTYAPAVVFLPMAGRPGLATRSPYQPPNQPSFRPPLHGIPGAPPIHTTPVAPPHRVIVPTPHAAPSAPHMAAPHPAGRR